MARSDCVFCRIVDGDLASNIVYADEDAIAFRDANPQAPTHILVVPRRHLSSVGALGEDDRALAGHLVLVAAEVARQEDLDADGYRLVANVGDRGGQTVDHLHVHLLGGRRMTWPPG